ncbi:hypothetical protein [Polynucleobacter sp. UB-Siik-W21]|uniref:hypothetical protein n=1 Tax=Polynucleobacter sp. UB-Siik-W21 TaxID=1855646 RepID=UPI001BFE12EB|nr:hypothetical protein [Polynucleobacter sp. UB-Siik-W21]QWD71361.1 hypothetical protein C2756_05220 [Polynucleobacter sp. UB-Siik-W21]
MTQLLSLFNQVFGNQSISSDLEKYIPSKALQALKVVQQAFLNLYDAWIEARLEQAKYYSNHSHIE